MRQLLSLTCRHAAAALALAVAWPACAADGLRVPEAAASWVQARFLMSGSETWGWRTGHSAGALGDYYFDMPSWWPMGRHGGLRASSGVITNFFGIQPGPKSISQGVDGTEALPYLGLGYDHSALAAGWGFSADLGLVAQSPLGALRVGRALLGPAQSLDDAVRSLRLAPVVQIGVRYSF